MTDRIISKELYQAETRIRKLRAQKAEAVTVAGQKWDERITEYIRDLPEEIRQQLWTLGIIESPIVEEL